MHIYITLYRCIYIFHHILCYYIYRSAICRISDLCDNGVKPNFKSQTSFWMICIFNPHLLCSTWLSISLLYWVWSVDIMDFCCLFCFREWAFTTTGNLQGFLHKEWCLSSGSADAISKRLFINNAWCVCVQIEI